MNYLKNQLNLVRTVSLFLLFSTLVNSSFSMEEQKRSHSIFEDEFLKGKKYASSMSCLDDFKAVEKFEVSAENGHPEAQFWLGSMYNNARGGLKDNEHNIKFWWGRSAEQGNINALYSRLLRFSRNFAKDLSSLISSREPLKILDLSKAHLTVENLKVLSKFIASCPHLEALHLKSTKLNDQGLILLSDSLPQVPIQFLNLWDNFIGDDGLAELSKTIKRTKILLLDLAKNVITDKGIECLSLFLPESLVEILHLGENKIGKEGAAFLGKAAAESHLAMLDLGRNNLEPEGIERFCVFLPSTQLKFLDLAGTNLKTKGAISLSKALPKTQIQILDLKMNEIENEGASLLFEVLPETQLVLLSLRDNLIDGEIYRPSDGPPSKSKLEFLNLRGNKVTEEALCKVLLNNPEIKTLNLENTRLSDRILRVLTGFLPKTKISSLNLSGNQITHEEFSFLAAILPSTSIIDLNCSGNKIGLQGAKLLADHLKNSQLLKLNLSGNKLDDESLTYLSKFLPSSLITHLLLLGNKIGKEGIKKLSDILPDTDIQFLDLGGNLLGDEGVEILAQALPSTKIHTLGLESNKISDLSVPFILKIFTPSLPLRSLNLLSNNITKEELKKLAMKALDSSIHTLLIDSKNDLRTHKNLERRDFSIAVRKEATEKEIRDQLEEALKKNHFSLDNMQVIQEAMFKDLPEKVTLKLGMNSEHKNLLIRFSFFVENQKEKEEINTDLDSIYRALHQGHAGYFLKEKPY